MPRLNLARRRFRGSLTAMLSLSFFRRLAPVLLLLAVSETALAAERITLRNGFDMVCDHTVPDGAKTLLYLDASPSNYIVVKTADVRSGELVPAPALKQEPAQASRQDPQREVLTPGELREVLKGAGQAHDLSIDLLASVVHAESDSRVHARSRVGAEGLMQLMPGTAAELGVHDVFAPEQNVGGGAAYLDALLRRYHGNLAWALAAYNAGPAAVDRWHGIPPYRETRAYVARIIHDFNRRYAAHHATELALTASVAKP